MQTMLHFLENDREKILSSVTKARSPEKTQEAVTAELDRLLYQYNEQAENDRVKETAAAMIQTARHMAALICGYGEVRVWERTVEEEKNKPQRRSRRFFWLFLLGGIGCFLAAFILFQMAGISMAPRDAWTPLLLLILSLAGLFAAGMFLSRSRLVSGKEKKELQTEITMDAESVYQYLHTAVMVMDKKLEEILSSAEWEARKRDQDAPPVLSPEQADLYAGLLEALYSRDGETALDRLADLKYYLHRQGIDCEDYSSEHAAWFDIMPSFREGTLRPALVRDGTVLKKGLASGGD